MTRTRKWDDPEKKQQPFLLNKTVLNKLKAYAIETDQSFDDVVKGPFDRFQNELLELSREVDQIRQNALVANTPTSIPIEPTTNEESIQLVTQ